jgi:hypothetical protein
VRTSLLSDCGQGALFTASGIGSRFRGKGQNHAVPGTSDGCTQASNPLHLLGGYRRRVCRCSWWLSECSVERAPVLGALVPRDVLSVPGAKATIAAQRGHTLPVCRETAIPSATHAAAVIGAPGIVLGVCAGVRHRQSDANGDSNHERENFHGKQPRLRP